MRPTWEDVNARARGLGARLLEAETLASLARSPDLAALARALHTEGVLTEEVPAPTAAILSLALRRAAARELRVLRRWLGPRDDVLAVVLDSEDRRSLRALVRGAVAGTGAEARLAGLIPTNTLPERLLGELASRAHVREQAALLLAAGHPCGSPLLAVASGEAEPDLFALELAIARTFAERARRGARRAGGLLVDYVATRVDLENCRAALQLTARGGDEPAAPVYIDDGRHVGLESFTRAAGAADPAAAARVLGTALGGGTFTVLLQRHASDSIALEQALEVELLAWLRHHARLDPLGPAPVLLYCGRLGLQAQALGRLVWGVDLGVPAAMRSPQVHDGAAA